MLSVLQWGRGLHFNSVVSTLTYLFVFFTTLLFLSKRDELNCVLLSCVIRLFLNSLKIFKLMMTVND